ncbi:hypothetical protein BH09ACT8_BH09ACT8_33780 [soil metagenome]
MSKDDYAAAIIAEGRGRGISVRGIKIALATALVESNLVMYANNGDPESLRFPHEALSFDANSVGLFQQRGPWWGTTADRMSPSRSAGMFYHALAGLDYNSDAHTPGWYAQAVQRSAFPTRYDARFAEASALFDRLSGAAAPVEAAAAVPIGPEFTELDRMTGGGRSPRTRAPINWLLHTEEGNSTAEQLAKYCDGSHGVSYHYTLRDGILCDVVDTDFASWSVLSANGFTINLCFAGSRAGWSRSEWLAREDDISIAAYIAVVDCRKYGIPIGVNPPPYFAGPSIADHKYVTQELHIGDHTDVGNKFPWDVFTNYVEKWAGIQLAPTPPPTPTPRANAKSVVPPVLKLGSTGPAVRTLQTRLKNAYAAYAGFIEVDGEFGPLTQGVVMEFQKRSSLPVDGIVDMTTASALRI